MASAEPFRLPRAIFLMNFGTSMWVGQAAVQGAGHQVDGGGAVANLKRDPADTVAMRQRICVAVQAGDRYPFESR